jgi:hypothetical protein
VAESCVYSSALIVQHLIDLCTNAEDKHSSDQDEVHSEFIDSSDQTERNKAIDHQEFCSVHLVHLKRKHRPLLQCLLLRQFCPFNSRFTQLFVPVLLQNLDFGH